MQKALKLGRTNSSLSHLHWQYEIQIVIESYSGQRTHIDPSLTSSESQNPLQLNTCFVLGPRISPANTQEISELGCRPSDSSALLAELDWDGLWMAHKSCCAVCVNDV
jgi:hypothetical protein